MICETARGPLTWVALSLFEGGARLLGSLVREVGFRLVCFVLLGLRRLRLDRSLAKLAALARTMLDLVGLLDLRVFAQLAHSRGSLRSHGSRLT